MRRAYIACLAGVACLALPGSAHAYPWMNRHGYTNCATCHADPSGNGLLTQYGRAQSELLLSSQYSKTSEEQEPGRFKDFLFGAVELPEELLLGAWLREGTIINLSDGKVLDKRLLHMRADVAAQLKLGSFRANVSVGAAVRDAAPLVQQAWLIGNEDGPSLVSREHWLGVDLADDAILVRAGRIALPFGLRNIEHTSWVRSETRTDVNQSQQHGVAASYNDEHFRAEVMAVAGNYQVSPDRYRDRGLSGYLEAHVQPGFEVGVSSLVVRAETDLNDRERVVRQAHGVFARLAPERVVAVLLEADALLVTRDQGGTSAGFAGLLQADVEPVQGLHGTLTAELLRRAQDDAELGVGLWAGAAWFFLPHFDVRADLIRRSGLSRDATYTALLQLHGYL